MTAVVYVLVSLPSGDPGRGRPERLARRGVRVWRVAQRRDPLRLPPRRQEDPTVSEANGAGGQEEGEHGRHQGKGQGDPQAALEGKPP